MADVVLSAVSKRYARGGAEAVRNVDLEVFDREFLVIVGPSGCGKSTLLRMIAGLEEMNGGTIAIGGRVVNLLEPQERDVAMVFQNFALYPHMSVYDNLAFALKLRDFPAEEIDGRVRETARLLDLEPLLDRYPHALSGGEAQRVAVGRAIVRKPKVFLFDEPLSNLDAPMRMQMRTEISKLHHQLGCTMIYVTHDQDEAMTMGDRICVMKDGVIQQLAEPLEVYDHPANLFVARFIGSPPMNLFEGKISRQAEKWRFAGENFSFELPEAWLAQVQECAEKPLVFGVRPEAVGGGAGSFLIRGRVDVIEQLGSEKMVHLTAGKNAFVARVEPRAVCHVGEYADWPVDLASAHLFDKESGQTLI